MRIDKVVKNLFLHIHKSNKPNVEVNQIWVKICENPFRKTRIHIDEIIGDYIGYQFLRSKAHGMLHSNPSPYDYSEYSMSISYLIEHYKLEQQC